EVLVLLQARIVYGRDLRVDAGDVVEDEVIARSMKQSQVCLPPGLRITVAASVDVAQSGVGFGMAGMIVDYPGEVILGLVVLLQGGQGPAALDQQLDILGSDFQALRVGTDRFPRQARHFQDRAEVVEELTRFAS